jgi:hypothetical protein
MTPATPRRAALDGIGDTCQLVSQLVDVRLAGDKFLKFAGRLLQDLCLGPTDFPPVSRSCVL